MTGKARKQIDYAVSTHTIERLYPSREAVRLCGQMASGKISANDAVSAVLKRYDLKRPGKRL